MFINIDLARYRQNLEQAREYYELASEVLPTDGMCYSICKNCATVIMCTLFRLHFQN